MFTVTHTCSHACMHTHFLFVFTHCWRLSSWSLQCLEKLCKDSDLVLVSLFCRFFSQLQDLQLIPTSCLRPWSVSAKCYWKCWCCSSCANGCYLLTPHIIFSTKTVLCSERSSGGGVWGTVGDSACPRSSRHEDRRCYSVISKISACLSLMMGSLLPFSTSLSFKETLSFLAKHDCFIISPPCPPEV